MSVDAMNAPAPAMAPPSMAGYIVGSLVEATAPPKPEMLAEFMAMTKSLPEEFGFEKVFAGPALKQYEQGAGKPNMSFIMKFATLQHATRFYDHPTYAAWKAKFGVGTDLKRDLRILEAPADLFTPGKAYWFALIHKVHDPDATMKYITKFLDTNGSFAVTLDDGSVLTTTMQIKHVGPSIAKEEALKFVPSAEEGKPFFMGTMDNQALVAFAEFPSHDVGKNFRASAGYKDALLAAFDKTFDGDDLAYAADLVTFSDTVFKRDVRIIGV